MGGIFLGLSPLALPITGTAVSLGAAGGLGARGAGVKMAAAFGAGLIVVYTVVGVAAGQIDLVVEGILRPYAGIGYLGIGTVLVGLAGWLFIKPAAFCAACSRSPAKSPTLLGAFALGVPGGFVNCPACAAVVTGIAASAAKLGNPIYSGAVMFALGVGHVAVLVIATWFLTKRWPPSARWLRWFQSGTAVLLLLVAAYFFYLGYVGGLGIGPRLP